LEQPLVSIVIPVYNGANFVARAIDSALMQTYPHCEVIVVNDGSCDEGKTDAICKSYGERIRYFEKPNGGVASALNCGISNMKGTFFSWLSHDDFYLPEKIAHQMQELASRSEDTILYSDYYMLYPEIHLKARVNFRKKYPLDLLDVPMFPVLFGLVSGCTVLFHKSHFERVGLFDESLLTTQDYEFWFRAFQGQKVHCCANADVCICMHRNQGSRTLPEVTQSANRLWCALMDKVPSYDMYRISGTKYLFYRDMEQLFQRFGCYEAKQHCADLAQAEMDNRNKPGKSEEQALLDCISEQYEKLSAQTPHREKVRVLTWSNIIAVLYEIRLNGVGSVFRRFR